MAVTAQQIAELAGVSRGTVDLSLIHIWERFQQILLFQEDQEQAEWIAQWEHRQKKHWKTYLEHCKHRVICLLYTSRCV